VRMNRIRLAVHGMATGAILHYAVKSYGHHLRSSTSHHDHLRTGRVHTAIGDQIRRRRLRVRTNPSTPSWDFDDAPPTRPTAAARTAAGDAAEGGDRQNGRGEFRSIRGPGRHRGGFRGGAGGDPPPRAGRYECDVCRYVAGMPARCQSAPPTRPLPRRRRRDSDHHGGRQPQPRGGLRRPRAH